MGQRAKQVFDQQAGATERSVRRCDRSSISVQVQPRPRHAKHAKRARYEAPLLLPLVPLYAAGACVARTPHPAGWEPVRRLRCPVISIGNLSTGGSGKTPLTIALARLLTARGFQVDVLSRGYGRRSAVPAPR